MTIKQRRAACKRQGLVYDAKTKRCRKRKSGKKKSKFRVHSGRKHKSGPTPMTRKHRSHHHRKHHRNANTDYTKLFITRQTPRIAHGSHRRKSWASQTAMTSAARRQLAKKNKKCFLGKGMKYPVCTKRGKPSCHGLIAAKSRSSLVDHTRSRYTNSKSRRMAKSVHKRASLIDKKHGCHHVYDDFRGKL